MKIELQDNDELNLFYIKSGETFEYNSDIYYKCNSELFNGSPREVAVVNNRIGDPDDDGWCLCVLLDNGIICAFSSGIRVRKLNLKVVSDI